MNWQLNHEAARLDLGPSNFPVPRLLQRGNIALSKSCASQGHIQVNVFPTGDTLSVFNLEGMCQQPFPLATLESI